MLVLLLPIMTQLALQGGNASLQNVDPGKLGGVYRRHGDHHRYLYNLLVVSIAQDPGMPAIGVFHYSHIVLIAALIALPYLWLVMPRLLRGTEIQQAAERHNFLATFRIGDASPHLGKDASRNWRKFFQSISS